MKLRKKTKGFTIIELVIVIAVIAVLAAVLIPTFINLTAKANKAADESLVTNLNTALATQEQVEGDTDNATMHDAVEDLKEYGYLLPNLVTKSSDKLLWDQEENRFLLESSETESNPLKYWRIQENLNEQKYNVYAGINFSASDTNLNAIKVGFDAGYHEDIGAIKYVGDGEPGQEVTIRTNGPDAVLTVDAPYDIVNHYNFLEELTVDAVADASYHEYGSVRVKATVSQGHFEIAKGGNVPTVSVENVPAGKTVKVTSNEPTIIIVDSASSSKTSVVANSKEIYVDGIDSSKISGDKATDVKLPTEVTNEATLKSAFAGGGFVKLAGDVTLTTPSAAYVRKQSSTVTENVIVNTTKKTVLDLNGHSIVSGNELSDDYDFFGVDDGASLKVCDNSSAKTGQIVANAKMFYVRGSLEIINGTYFTTVLCSGTDFRSMIITDNNSSLILDDGLFYTPKCVLTSWADEVTINGGKYVVASATAWKNVPESGIESWAYTVRLGKGKNTINGGEFYGIQGGISLEGGESVVKNAKVNVSGETLAKFSEFTNGKVKIHPLDNRAAEFYVTPEMVNTHKSAFNSASHYAIYVAGEKNLVYATVESGDYSTDFEKAVYIGNNHDGGQGFFANCTLNGGKFVAPEGKAAVYETGTNIAYGAGSTEIFGGQYSTDVSLIMKDTTRYACKQNSQGMWVVSAK